MNFFEEREKIEKAILIVDKLSEGIDPYTGEIFDDEHITNNPKVVRCLKYVEEILKETLRTPATIRKVNNKDLAPFAITEEEKANIQYRDEAISLTNVCKLINEAARVEEKGMKTLKAMNVNDALAEMGILKITNFNNKRRTVLQDDYKTGYGIAERLGVFNGITSMTVVYDKEGQKFIVDNLDKILEYID